MFSGIVSVIPWKDNFIQFILQFVVLIFHAENLIKKKKKSEKCRFVVFLVFTKMSS